MIAKDHDAGLGLKGAEIFILLDSKDTHGRDGVPQSVLGPLV
jgi:hypothetical protein